MLNFALPFLAPLLGIAKRIGWKGWLIIGIAGASFYLYQWIDRLQKENEAYEWLLAAKEAENDTLRDIGEYVEPDTIWDSTSVAYAVYDTVSGDSVTLYKKMPWAKIFGSIKFDTTQEFGPGSNRITVRVKGQFWYPKEYGSRNWMTIAPKIPGKPPGMPMARQSEYTWGMGLIYARSIRDGAGNDYMGISVRYRRLTLAGGYDYWRKAGLATIGFEALRF